MSSPILQKHGVDVGKEVVWLVVSDVVRMVEAVGDDVVDCRQL